MWDGYGDWYEERWVSIEELINKLNGSFRGLWTGVVVYDSFGGIVKKQEWSVTFVYDGDYLETPGFATPQQALEYAIIHTRR